MDKKMIYLSAFGGSLFVWDFGNSYGRGIPPSMLPLHMMFKQAFAPNLDEESNGMDEDEDNEVRYDGIVA
jgi:hypothetical protein